jgi:hypothetical protein
VLAACASLEVGSYVRRGIDMRQYRTYNWAPFVEQSTGDPRLDNNRFFKEHVQLAIDRELATRGLEKTDTPDVLIRYHASIMQEAYISGAGYDRTHCDECRPELFDTGTLLIDFVDARTSQLVWRGWAKSGVDGAIDDQEWMERKIDDAVARILQRLSSR